MGGRSARWLGGVAARARELKSKIRNVLASRGRLRWPRSSVSESGGSENAIRSDGELLNGGAPQMNILSQRMLRVVLLALLPLMGSQQGNAADKESPIWFEITTETGMPNLENNLRYLTTHEKRCLTRAKLHRFFPVLDHPALASCHLGDALPGKVNVVYPLVCEAHGATGQAIWETNLRRSIGTLNIKLGGKNMTFFQRITASDLGGCGR
jgi:hypothetical protein